MDVWMHVRKVRREGSQRASFEMGKRCVDVD
jgi:hypothetical protein